MSAFTFTNFTAGLRKPDFVPFNFGFFPSDTFSWIQSVSVGSYYAQSPLSGAINGINRVFVITGAGNVISILRNGLVLDPTLAYSLSGTTVTFTNSSAYIPQIGDDLQALLG